MKVQSIETLDIISNEIGISLDTKNFNVAALKAHRFIENWDSNFLTLGVSNSNYVHKSAKIHSSAIIGTEIFIGPNVEIGPFCFLRSKIILFPGVKLGFGVELDRIVLFQNVKIAHSACLGRSFIGKNCNISFNNVIATRNLFYQIKAFYNDQAYFLSKAIHHGGVIGDNVKTGVNVSFMPGFAVYPDRFIMPGIQVLGFH